MSGYYVMTRNRFLLISVLVAAVAVSALLAVGRCEGSETWSQPEPGEPVRVSPGPPPLSADLQRDPVGEPDSAPPTADLQVLVVSDRGRPIDGAEVTLLALDLQVLASGVSDAAGEAMLAVPATPADGRVVAAAAAGHARRRVGLPRALPDRVRLVLPAGAHIEGRVFRLDGGALPEDTQVLAWPQDGIDRPIEMLLAGAGEPWSPVLEGELEDSGHFRIDGVDPGAGHVVVARADGWCVPESVRDVRSSGGFVSLELWRLYAVAAEAVGAPGEPPLPRSSLAVTGYSWPDHPDRRRNHGSLDELLALGTSEIPGQRIDGGTDWRFRVLTALLPYEAAAVDGPTITYKVPGFERTSASLELQPAAAGRIARVSIPIERVASGFANLVVRLDMQSPPRWPSTRYPSQARLEVLADSPSGVRTTTPVLPVLAGALEEHGFPRDRYRIRLVTRGGWASSYHRVDLRDGDGEVTIACRRMGAILLEPDRYAAHGRGTSLEVSVQRGSRRVRFPPLKGPPYLIQGLLAGSYTIHVGEDGPDAPAFSLGPIEVEDR